VGSFGIQDQFWLQIAESPISFHGAGVRNVPAAAPAANRSSCRR
jgi:hypothetical protein